MSTATAAKTKKSTVDLSQVLFYLQLNVRRPGVRRSVDSKDVIDADQTDPDLMSVSKDIVASQTYRRIESLDSRVRNQIRALGVPAPSWVKGGYYPLTAPAVEEVEQVLQQYSSQREALIEEFVAEYAKPGGLIAEAKERLGPRFDEGDYPTPSRMKAAFRVEWNFWQFETPTALKGVSAAMFDRAKKKAEEMWARAHDEIRYALRAQASKLFQHMLSLCAPEDADGKHKVFKSNSVTKLEEFLATEPFRNVTNDEELTSITHKMRDLMRGVDVDSMKDETFRAALEKKVAALTGKLDALVTEAAERGIAFD